MGILDNKSRIVDTVLTWEGRQQFSEGKLGFVYYSFSDDEIVYDSSSPGVIDDASKRFYFEAPYALPQDQIAFRADDSGFLQDFLGSGVRVEAGTLLTSSFVFFSTTASVVTGTYEFAPAVGDQFASLSEKLLSGSIDNFSRLSLIRSTNRYFAGELPVKPVTSNGPTFKERGVLPSTTKELSIANSSFFGDRKLSSAKNFKYLPPISANGSQLGIWPQVDVNKSNEPLTWSEIEASGTLGLNYNGILKSGEMGSLNNVKFEFAPADLKLAAQSFEVNGSGVISKLDMYDAGTFKTNDVERPLARVVFVGKVYINSKNLPCFLSIFTLVFR